MENFLPNFNPDDLGKAGELVKNTAGYLKLAEVVQKVIGERAAMFIFGKQTTLEAERARKLMEVGLEQKIYTDALDSFVKTESGKEMQNAVASALFHQQFSKLSNIGKIAEIAADQIDLSKTQIPDEPIDNDWLKRCLEYGGDASTEEIQALWGRILAGEILRPESFSLRTIDFLRSIDRRDADVINDLSKRAFLINNTSFLVGTSDYYTEDEKLGLVSQDIYYLKDLGLLSLEPRRVNLSMSFSITHNKKYISIQHGKHTIFFDVDTPLYNVYIPAINLTIVGEQIRRLVDSPLDMNLIKFLYDQITIALNGNGQITRCSYVENDSVIPAKYSRGQALVIYMRGSEDDEHDIVF